MSKEMLFLCDVYTKWLEENELPHRCASELLYGKDTIDEYDDNLYDVLVPYVLDEDGAYDILQEYIHERHENDWIDDVWI